MLAADGYIFRDGNFVRAHAVFGRGVPVISEGPLGGDADITGLIIRDLTDCHTHCADAGVRLRPGMTLDELVAPPNGLKHVYLRNTPKKKLIKDMAGFGKKALSNGITSFMDFREGGAEGCRMLRSADTQAVIFGRPMFQKFDSNEIEDLLIAADGLSISSVSDVDVGYAEAIADACYKAGKPFALHVSEKVREDMDLVLSLGPAFVVHMVEATDADFRRCADANIPIVVCPRSNAYFGKIPPLKRMLDAGADVALGTDNAMLCTPDMRPEALAAMKIMELQHGDTRIIWRCMLDVPGKILSRVCHCRAKQGKGHRTAVLPFEGEDPRDVLCCGLPATVP